MTMRPSLKCALVWGAVACIATANPVSRQLLVRPDSKLNDTAPTTSTGYPSDTYITMTKHLTLVIKNTPVDCAHGPSPTPFALPSCDFENGTSPMTTTRYYCGGEGFPPWERDPDEMEDDVDYDADEEDFDENDEDEDTDEDEDEDMEDEEDDDYLTQRMLGPPVLNFERTTTVYTTTSTVSQLVNCGRCTAVTTVPYFSPGYPPQFPNYTTTVTAIQPTTTTLLNCEPQPTQDGVYAEREIVRVGGIPVPVRTHLTKVDHWPPLVTTYTDFPRGRDEVECAMYYNLFPSRLGSVRKIYTATKTTTAHKDCGVCALVWGTAAYPFEVGPLPTTKTKKGKTTITAMACRTPKGSR
ncbi:hypothetical protein N5P37_000742 [Trichoderma harzianum]|nr:hypothetical protein N5P37_000742 [Trichoderma harzianum]